MLNQSAVEIPTLPVNQCLSHLIQIPGGMLSRSLGMPSRREGPPSIWDTHGISGNVFVDPVASSSAPYHQELNPWSSGRAEQTSPHVMSESQTQFKIRDASAKNSFIPSEGHSSKIYGACLLEDKIQD